METELHQPSVTVNDPPLSIFTHQVQTNMKSLGKWPNVHSTGSCTGFWESRQCLREQAILNDRVVRHMNTSIRNYNNHGFIWKIQNNCLGYINRKHPTGILFFSHDDYVDYSDPGTMNSL